MWMSWPLKITKRETESKSLKTIEEMKKQTPESLSDSKQKMP